jgi:cysteine desulfurase
VVSAIEHKAILAAAHAVCALGGREIVLPVHSNGRVDLDALDAALADRPAVVSIMWVNNEVGVIQPVREIAERCRAAGVPFHTDAVQAFGKLPVCVTDFPCTLLTLSGHKIGAPKGIGALIVRDRKAVEAIIHGGGQQYGIRPGTENVAGAVALGRAAALAATEQQDEAHRLARLRDTLADKLKATIPDLVVNAERSERAPHVLNVSIANRPARARPRRDPIQLRQGEHGRGCGSRRPGDAGGCGQGSEAGGDAGSCLSASSSPCRAEWTARWPPHVSWNRATRWSAPP